MGWGACLRQRARHRCRGQCFRKGRVGDGAGRGYCRWLGCRRLLARRAFIVMNSGPGQETASLPPAIYVDATSSGRRTVALAFADQLEVNEDERSLAAWSYADIRRADSPSGTLRLTCLTAAALAGLEIRDAVVAAELSSRCARLDENV